VQGLCQGDAWCAAGENLPFLKDKWALPRARKTEKCDVLDCF
jgi:hypothetical protein